VKPLALQKGAKPLLVTGNPGSDHGPNLAITPQIVAEKVTYMFNGL
jgi:hypothetical protein